MSSMEVSDVAQPSYKAKSGSKQDTCDAGTENVSPSRKERETGGNSLSIVAGSAGAQFYYLRLSESCDITVARKDKLPEEGVGDVCVRGDGRILAVGGWDSRVRLFHMRTGKRLAVLKQHRASITEVKFDNSGLIACASRDKTVSLWDVYRGSR
jgi:WD40 repeat protein